MIAVGYFIFALSMWYYASFDLGTDYKHEALARALQGLGIAPLFIPVSQLAYSFLPKEKNNKASSLTNLFRNQGASFGIAFTTTVVARRTQYHRTVLVAHATPLSARYQEVLTSLSAYFARHGFSAADASLRVQLAPDGRTILSASEDRTIRVWDRASGKEVRRLLGHQGPVTALALAAQDSPRLCRRISRGSCGARQSARCRTPCSSPAAIAPAALALAAQNRPRSARGT